ncbi:MAG: hypothetical protein ACYC7A_04390 [Thermoanaerobaculia bacterium]
MTVVAWRSFFRIVQIGATNGIFPMRAFPKEMYGAKFFRDRAARMADAYWLRLPETTPLVPYWDGDLGTDSYDGRSPRAAAASCDIDHAVSPAPLRGGREAALAQLRTFVAERLDGYAARHNREAARSSGLSPYLHFGFISVHELALAAFASGAPAVDVDALLEQAIIRRELSFNMCHFRPDHESLDVLPDWARRSLDAHRSDRRKPQYGADAVERPIFGSIRTMSSNSTRRKVDLEACATRLATPSGATSDTFAHAPATT